jgi:hypothetical protein
VVCVQGRRRISHLGSARLVVEVLTACQQDGEDGRLRQKKRTRHKGETAGDLSSELGDDWAL